MALLSCDLDLNDEVVRAVQIILSALSSKLFER